MRDDEGRSQGTLLLEVLTHEATDPKGHWITGRYVVASDGHMRWWMSDGEGRVLAKRGSFHFCEENSQDCQETRKSRGKCMHLEKFREITQKEVDGKVPGWAFEGAPKKIFAAYLKQVTLPEEPPGKKEGLPWQKPGEESDAEEGSEESSVSVAMKDRLKRARDELKRLEDRAQQKKQKKKLKRGKGTAPAKAKAVKKRDRERREREDSPAPGRDREKKRRRKRSPGDEVDRDRGRRRRKDKVSSSGTGDLDAEESPDDLFGEVVPDRPGGSERKGRVDRGPFGGGDLVKFRGRSDSESASFQDAPAGRKASSQLKLASYAKKKPGRLASRMLLKMVKESAHGSVGAVVNDPNPTPPAAVHYLMTVLTPQLGSRLNLRTQRELKTICTAVDMLAQKQPAQAADVLAQRVKALVKAGEDGHWNSAQFLELSPEGSSLLERAEEVYTSREYLLDMKIKNYDKPKGHRPEGRGQGDKGGKKGREKGKGKGKDGDKKETAGA